MGVLQRFERRHRGAGQPAVRPRLQGRGPAGRDRQRAPARVRRPGRDRGPRPHHGAQRVHVELGAHDHERLSVYAEALGELAAMVREHAEEQGYVVPRAGDRELRAGRRPRRPAGSRSAARPWPAPTAGRVRHRRAGGRPPAPASRGSRSAATTYALASAVTRHRPRRRRRPAHRRPRHLPPARRDPPVTAATSASSTSARPTASSSTASQVGGQRLPTAPGSQLGSTTMVFQTARR